MSRSEFAISVVDKRNRKLLGNLAVSFKRAVSNLPCFLISVESEVEREAVVAVRVGRGRVERR